MQLLNTIAKPNSLVAHALDYVAIYSDPKVSLYKKLPDTNDLSLVTEYTLAGVKRLAISDNGQVVSAQTATQTHRLSVAGASPYDVVGQLAVADRNYTVVLTPTAVQVIRETVVNMNTTLGTGDRVVCGLKTFVVYNSSRSILGSYDAGLQAPVSPGRTISHVAHIGGDKFAYFYLDGTVSVGAAVRASAALMGHRDSGRHIVANNNTHEYAYMKNAPLTAPVLVRPFTPPPIPNEMFSIVSESAAPTFTIERTIGASVEDPPSLGAASVIIAHGGQDNVRFVLDQPLNLASTDWTLEWSSLNLSGADGNYYAEIALLPTTGNNGLTARWGDGGFQNRLQFGGRVDLASNNYNVNLTKAAVVNVLKKYRLVKQGVNVEAYIDDVRQNFAAGTGTTYNMATFPLDTDLSAIKHIVIGAFAWGGYALGAIRGPVKLTLAAVRPPFSMITDGTLNPSLTPVGSPVIIGNEIQFGSGKYLSMPATSAPTLGTSDFEIYAEVNLVSSNAAAGSSLFPIIYWGTWAAPGQPLNFEFYYNDDTNSWGFANDFSTYALFPHDTSKSAWHKVRLTRIAGVMTVTVDDVVIGTQAYPHNISFDANVPLTIGRRAGGTSGNVVWYANMAIRALDIKFL